MRIFGLWFAVFFVRSLIGLNCVGQEPLLPNRKVQWYEMEGVRFWGLSVLDVSFGRSIGVGSFPFNFYYDWDFGYVYKNHKDRIGFKAFLELEIPASIALDLEVGADDGVRLYIDGELVIDAWALGSYRKFRTLYPLTAGKHRLELHYFEWEGVAKVKFAADTGALLVLSTLTAKPNL